MMGVQNTNEKYEPGMSTRGRSVPTSLEMHHASSIGSRLLGCIDVIEKEVGRADSTCWSIELTSFFLDTSRACWVQGDGGGLQETGLGHGQCHSPEQRTWGSSGRVGEALVGRGTVHHGVVWTCWGLAGLFVSSRCFSSLCWRCDSMSHDFPFCDMIIWCDIFSIPEGHLTCLHEPS